MLFSFPSRIRTASLFLSKLAHLDSHTCASLTVLMMTVGLKSCTEVSLTPECAFWIAIDWARSQNRLSRSVQTLLTFHDVPYV